MTRISRIAATVLLVLAAALPAAAHQGWAVVVNGDDTELHRANVADALEALEARGWPSDRIRVLGAADSHVLDGMSLASHSATRDDLVEIFDEIDRDAAPDEPVLLYWTGHSTKFMGRVSVHLDRGTLGLRGIEKALTHLGGRDLVLVVDVCYAGALAELEYDGRLTVVSATDDAHTVLCRAFARPFWAAVAHAGSDRDSDGEIHLSEVWQTTRDAIPHHDTSDAPRPMIAGDASWFSFGAAPVPVRLARRADEPRQGAPVSGARIAAAPSSVPPSK